MKKILYQPWGGLGDNLAYSTLPEKFHELNSEVYLSDKNEYRSPEIYNLIWELNPNIKGISNENHNIGSCVPYSRVYRDKSAVFNIEFNHGLEPTNEIPKLFYKPKRINELENCVFIDISAKSHIPQIPYDFNDYLKSFFINKTILIPVFKNQVDSQKRNDFNFDSEINIESIFHYCDIIESCFYFVCAFSGQSVVASALNKTNTTCFVKDCDKASDYIFPNIDYFPD